MPDGDVIDSLSLEIGAGVDKSINAIDQLQKQLGVLNNSLENFRDNGTYKRALDNLSSGFSQLAASIDGLDPDKITKVSNSLKGLVKHASKINDTFSNSGSIGRSTNGITKELDEQGKAIASTFGVTGAKKVDAVVQSFRSLTSEIDSSGNKTSNFKAKLTDLVKTIRSSLDVGSLVGDGGDSIAEQVRKYVTEQNKSGSKVYLPFEPSEFADDFRSMRSTFGKMFTSDDMAFFDGAKDIAQFAKEMNTALGENVIKFDDSWANGNEADIFRQIYDLLVKARTEQDELTKSAREYAIAESDVANAVDAVIPQVQALKNVTVSEGGETNGITALAQALKEFKGTEIPDFTNLASLAKAVKSFSSEKTSVASEIIPRLVEGLKPLNGDFHIPDFTNLATMASGVNRLGSSSATAASVNIPIIASGLKWLDGINVPDFSNLGGLASAVTRLGNANSQNAAWVLPNIMAELESFSQHFSGLAIDTNSLTTIQQLGSAFSKLGGKNVSEAMQNLPQLSDAIKKIVEDLNNLPELSDKTQQLVVALSNLARANGNAQTATTNTNKAFSTFSNTVKGLSGWVVKTWKNTNVLQSAIKGLGGGISKFNSGMTSAKTHTESLTGAIIKVRTILWGLKRAFSFFEGAIENASSLTEVANVVENVYDASYMEEFNKAAQGTIDTLGMSQLTFEQYASRYQAMGKAMGITNSQMQGTEDHLKSMGIEYGVTTGKMGDMSVNLTRLAADMASFYDVSQEDVYTSLQAIYTGQTRPLMLAA